MAEREPGFQPAPQDERDTVAQLQAEAEKLQAQIDKIQAQTAKATFDRDQKEAFGKFDVTVPNEGEDTYQSYLDQRPAEGIVRDDESYRDAQSRKFASEAAYEAQVGTAQDYYDQKMGVQAQQEVYEAPDYTKMSVQELFHERSKAEQLGDRAEVEHINHKFLYEQMGVMQLAKEAARARQQQDTKEEERIQKALVHHLQMDAMKDDTETPEEAQHRYETETARYDQLVDRFLDRGQGETHHASDTHEANPGEGEASRRTADAAPTAAPTEQPSDTPEDATRTDVGEEESESVEPGGYYNGKKVTVTNAIEHPSGDSSKDALTVIDEDGNISTIHASEIEYRSGTSGRPGKELELYNADGKELEATEREATKKWWQKAGEYIRKRAGIAYWAAQFNTYVETPVREGWSKWLEYGVTDAMSAEEKEQRRKDNRYVAIAAGGAFAVIGGVITGVLIAKGLSSGGAGTHNSIGLGEHNDWTRHTAEGLNGQSSGVEHGVKNLPLNGPDTVGSETIPPVTPHAAEFTITSGEGGEELFQRLQIDTSKWYDNAQTMLHNFPQDFYLEGNDVRIAHTGPLSQGAQDFINSLR